MPFDYRGAHDSANAELERLSSERGRLALEIAEIDKQMMALQQTLAALAPVVGEEPPELTEAAPMGMTVAVRTILAIASEPLSAAAVRDRLAEMGFAMDSYSNPLATVHTVLRRLAESEEAKVEESAESGKRFSAVPGKGHVIGLALERKGGKFGFDLVAGKSFAAGKELKGYLGVVRKKRER